ncbi:MAG: hypothetical protein KA109_06620 [Saprospiraceae bacterium]|nr:hypothetical protein [Saprospiraceae bacterium]MBK6477923.1 hypothetical protein [Saprospiraceae bacterium]MBK7373291.1 hypothetical protein [Saprospiraceae bacterium]MBK7436952.1 hypothetical protein [Saprospiraceae bacterium]MBK8282962.1 hypothetical protein [Saprospiraceae bacterium]
MNNTWFKRVSCFYIPTSMPGWVILMMALGYAAYQFRVIDRDSHSVSDTLINWGFQVLMISAVYTLVAYGKLRKWGGS